MRNKTKNVLLYEEKNRVAIVTLNRPEQHNALSKSLLNNLDLILEKIKKDKNINKFFEKKEINKTFFVKNRLINFIIK